MDHTLPELKYVSAKDLDDNGKTLAGLPVTGLDGETLGHLQGFIIDVSQGRPRHVVVEAGWFIHKHFLLPIGHAGLDADGAGLTADITKDRVKRFPGFSMREFQTLSAADLRRLDEEIAAACDDGDDLSAVQLEIHYRLPGWWKSTYYSVPAGGRR
jgi:hypothetical protein